MVDPDIPIRRMPARTRSNFLTRTATDDAAQLDRRLSFIPSTAEERRPLLQPDVSGKPYEPTTSTTHPSPRRHETTERVLGYFDGSNDQPTDRRSSDSRRKSSRRQLADASLTTQLHNDADRKELSGTQPKIGSMPRPIGGSGKLGTFSGVFVPTTLNVLSILMFLRFGFILGQSGVVGMLAMLAASYIINFVTTLSISAIATNGTVRGGGAYYLISRSLGPEFGGSIGVVFYLGFVFNTGMNAVGLIDCLEQNFGEFNGNWASWLPEGFWFQYLWATIILVMCTAVCLAGSSLFARCSHGLLVVLLLATFSIPFSLVQPPFHDPGSSIHYTGLSIKTFTENLFPRFTRHADGSQLHGKENFQDLFGILFPATGGIFAGASMSGDLKHPGKAIPKGTLAALALTFLAYTIVILAMAASITRGSLYHNVNIIQETNISGVLILLGEIATSLFSTLMGVIGSAKLLQALARDNLLPGFSKFGQGTKINDEPTYAILFTYVVAQLTMLSDINQIASFVTMTYLMTFLVTNLACFLLTISSAPNFRPSFHYFNWYTAGFGTIISGVSMFFVDGLYATGCVGLLVIIFLIIHYTTPPKSWGDVSQSLIYHQVRKYLLRLRQEHVKFWRPQILLFVNDPRRQYELIQFCNSLKKGALFVLGHVIVTPDFGNAVPEARRQQAAWTKYIDFSKVKAFVNIAISPAVEWGTRNIVLSAGLGGMRPNIVILGAYNLEAFRNAQSLADGNNKPETSSSTNKASSHTDDDPRVSDIQDHKLRGLLPTDACRIEGAVNVKNYVTILEDLLLKLQINVAIAKGFKDLEFPQPKGNNKKKNIDLWPIQMSAQIAAESGDNVLTTNFDTYTLILQLGCILNTVPAWKTAYRLRVIVFVEYEFDVEEERSRVKTLLDNLRIQAEIHVFWLASGDLKSYDVIVNGRTPNQDALRHVDEDLKEEAWWQDVQKLRIRRGAASPSEELADTQGLLDAVPSWPSSSFQQGRGKPPAKRFETLKKLIRKSKRRRSSGDLNGLGMRQSMQTHRLHDDVLQRHASYASASEDSGSDDTSSETFEDDFADDIDKTSTSQNNAPGFDGKPSNASLRAESDELTQSLQPIRPTPTRHSSAPKFSSRPQPKAKVNSQDGPGPSIMFTGSPSSPSRNSPSIYRPPSATPATGFPFSQSTPLSFNDLPCRAQHLILNELMRQHSQDTAVLFTTLPSPVEGTCENEDDCVRYLSDLEVLWKGLPPVLMIHSNSMTVTMNL